MLSNSRFLILLILPVLCSDGAIGEESDAPRQVPPPQIRQITLPNPVKDSLVLIHRSLLSPIPADGVILQMPGLIEVRHPEPAIGYAWDPVECRLLFVWRNDSMTDLIQVAEGPGPLAGTIGAFGTPEYFGYRLVQGVPEFLYHYGALAVTERIEPATDGKSLVQRWTVHQGEFDLMLAVPERWKNLIKSSAGKWQSGFFTIPKSSANDFSLTWMIGQPPKLPEVPAAWAATAAAVLPPPPTTPFEKPKAPKEEPIAPTSVEPADPTKPVGKKPVAKAADSPVSASEETKTTP